MVDHKMENEKLSAEIRTLKLQYLVTILTLLGAVIAFFIMQKKDIIDLFTKKPVLSFVTREDFVKKRGKIVINDNKGETVFNSDFQNIPEKLELVPGNYTAKLNMNGDVLWSTSIFLKSNEKQIIELPAFFDRKIELSIDEINSNIQIGDEIKLKITASGNGYLWVYEIVGGSSKLRYPINTLQGTNTITATKDFEFPDGYGLYAGNEARKEKYCFLVTSVNDEEYADKVLSLLFPKAISKGEVTNIKKNWGAKIIQVEVRK